MPSPLADAIFEEFIVPFSIGAGGFEVGVAEVPGGGLEVAVMFSREAGASGVPEGVHSAARDARPVTEAL